MSIGKSASTLLFVILDNVWKIMLTQSIIGKRRQDSIASDNWATCCAFWSAENGNVSALGKRQAVTDRQRMAVSISEKICIVLPIFGGLLFDATHFDAVKRVWQMHLPASVAKHLISLRQTSNHTNSKVHSLKMTVNLPSWQAYWARICITNCYAISYNTQAFQVRR